MELRYYQTEAVNATRLAIQLGNNPVLQLATGTGKSLIIAEIARQCREQDKLVWVLTHSQQLVQQNADTYLRHTGENPGIICSGLSRGDYNAVVTYGTVQSVVRPALKGEIRYPDFIVIDEAHRVPHNTDEVGQYQRIFEHYPDAKRIGMSATPWRMDNGLIYGEGDGFWFNTLAYTYTVEQGVYDGFLSPLVGVETEQQLNLDDVELSGDEFRLLSVEKKMTDRWLLAVVESLKFLADKRKRIAVYCPTVKSAEWVTNAIQLKTGWTTALVTGETRTGDRKNIFKAMEQGKLRVLCSVDTITTGFDMPALDCIVCLRPTLSSNLWVQIQGRGTRLSSEKHNCLVLDYVGNYQRLGGVNMLDKYVREFNREAAEEILASEVRKPFIRKERRILPGVRSLVPINPMTGKEVSDGDSLTLQVHSMSSTPITTRQSGKRVIMVTYACTTPENARIDCTWFLNTENNVRAKEKLFFENRSLAVKLPSPADSLSWVVRNAQPPKFVRATKKGRYWNVVEELF